MGKRSVAGTNEHMFKNYFENKYGIDILKGKRTYCCINSSVSISVDNSIQIGNKEVLIEIDSGNMAKLLVGQYVLLNELCDSEKELLFLVVHFYKGDNDKEYNPERTVTNLDLINREVYKNEGIKYKVFNFSGFKEFCNQCNSSEDFISKIYSSDCD